MFTIVLIVLAALIAWVLVSVALALFLGRAIKIADTREHRPASQVIELF